MGLLLAISEMYVPRLFQKRKLEMLFSATADAFQVSRPATRGLAYDDCLRTYARFTEEQASACMDRRDASSVQARLFCSARQIGREIRADFDIRTAREVMRVAAVIYKSLNIEFHGEPEGDIVIERCLFSQYYSSTVCRLISSLDEGLLAGLSNGGKLTFSKRITEGNESCRARLDTRERPE